VTAFDWWPMLIPRLQYGDLVRRIDRRLFADLAVADLTYQEVGATRDASLPADYGHVDRDVIVGAGRSAFDRAVDGLFGWDVHRGAGLAVNGGDARAAPGVVVVLRAGRGPLRLTIPCRVIYTVDDADHRGFAYGTLPGHPEQGEEAFLITMASTGEVRFRVRAFSRPASLLARWGGPLTRTIQEYATDRYVKAMRRIVRTSVGRR
jgi:uncharacterized protein (UPF0548 family)